MLKPAELLWNRACNPDCDATCPGDRALAGLLLAHGLAMNGGVLHAVECLDEARFDRAVLGYRYFGLPAIADLLIRARSLLSSEDLADDVESELDLAYGAVVPDDSLLTALFEAHYAGHPDAYAPADE